MKAIASLLLLFVAACAANTSESASSDEADLASRGRTLKNGADVTIMGGPAAVRVSASAKDVHAKITDSSLATCTLKVDHAASSASKTIFDVAIDYELDDGFNGCTIAFDAEGYHSQLTVGLDIDD